MMHIFMGYHLHNFFYRKLPNFPRQLPDLPLFRYPASISSTHAPISNALAFSTTTNLRNIPNPAGIFAFVPINNCLYPSKENSRIEKPCPLHTPFPVFLAPAADASHSESNFIGVCIHEQPCFPVQHCLHKPSLIYSHNRLAACHCLDHCHAECLLLGCGNKSLTAGIKRKQLRLIVRKPEFRSEEH